jgi:peptide deformylase
MRNELFHIDFSAQTCYICAVAIREIRKYPDPVLRTKTAPVKQVDESLQRLIDDMVETMHAAPGVGLAANQVGVPLQLAVIDVSPRDEKGRRSSLMVIINPEIIAAQGSVVEEEGCLSIPEIAEKVKRSAKVVVRAQDRTGRSFEMEAEGLLARRSSTDRPPERSCSLTG